jgi:hypothetical protein
MRDQWYSDNRDIIKWSVLLLLARQLEADRVIQVAFLNPSDFGHVELDGERFCIPEEVLSQFRDIRSVTRISRKPQVSVFDAPFTDRSDYLNSAIKYIESFRQERLVIFLDPDTGLEPNGGGGPKHVLNGEARSFWKAISTGNALVFYQHETNKAGRPWIEEKRSQFAEAIGLPLTDVKVASGPEIAKDVVFFYATKA